MEPIDVSIDELEYPSTEKLDLGSTVQWYAAHICHMKRTIRMFKRILKDHPNDVHTENRMYHLKVTIAELEKEKQQAKDAFYSLEGEPTELPSDFDTDTSSCSDSDSIKAHASLLDLTDLNDISMPEFSENDTDSAESTGALNTPRSDESAEHENSTGEMNTPRYDELAEHQANFLP